MCDEDGIKRVASEEERRLLYILHTSAQHISLHDAMILL